MQERGQESSRQQLLILHAWNTNSIARLGIDTVEPNIVTQGAGKVPTGG